MSIVKIPQFAAGAVYFRKSNPPAEDWERDYRTAREDGINTFRHWFLWGAIEIAPGRFDWADYDRQLELGAEYGIGAVIAEHLAAPEWIYAEIPDAFLEDRSGSRQESEQSASCATGFGGVCLDNPAVRERAGAFLTALAERYKSHAGLLGYDIQNEFHRPECFCAHTAARFRTWLLGKYGSLEAIARAWRRYSYTDLEQVKPPRFSGPYPECLDWLAFQKDRFYEDVRWKIGLIRAQDADCAVTGHGEAAALNNYVLNGSDEWRAAQEVELYGMTYVQERHGTESWRQLHCADLTRAGARGKPWWHAEFQGGHVWINPFVHTKLTGRGRYDGRMVRREDIRLWSFLSIAGGARGILSPRYRPLLDGYLFGSYGFYGNDGSRTDRSEMFGEIARWANDPGQSGFFSAKAARGQVGLLVLDEALLLKQALGLETDTNVFDKAISGAYRAFHDLSIQADFVDIRHIGEYDLLLLPYPIAGREEHFQQLRDWVLRGGRLICQGCPAYFGIDGHVSPKQPGLGHDDFFGAEESYVELLPDIAVDIRFHYDGLCARGGLFKQGYRPLDGEVTARYGDGQAAVVEREQAAGKTMLIGTYPSVSYYDNPTEENRAFFRKLLAWGGKEPAVLVDDGRVIVRLFEGADARYLIAVNPSGETVRASIHLQAGAVRSLRVLWGSGAEASGGAMRLIIPPEDACIVQYVH